MEITSAEYVKSAPSIRDCPDETRPEFAFVGRSNVGKSSLINFLTSRKKLAQTSANPGKTKYLNYFIINNSWYLVDLPGYGFAKVSKTDRESWEKNLKEYLQKRESLQNVFLLVDINIPPQQNDLLFMQWMGEKSIPFSIVFTKADKSGKTVIQKNVAAYKKQLKKNWAELPPLFVTSVSNRTGREEILDYINRILAHSA